MNISAVFVIDNLIIPGIVGGMLGKVTRVPIDQAAVYGVITLQFRNFCISLEKSPYALFRQGCSLIFAKYYTDFSKKIIISKFVNMEAFPTGYFSCARFFCKIEFINRQRGQFFIIVNSVMNDLVLGVAFSIFFRIPSRYSAMCAGVYSITERTIDYLTTTAIYQKGYAFFEENLTPNLCAFLFGVMVMNMGSSQKMEFINLVALNFLLILSVSLFERMVTGYSLCSFSANVANQMNQKFGEIEKSIEKIKKFAKSIMSRDTLISISAEMMEIIKKLFPNNEKK
ncbi:MAG: hypothetical protein L0207_07020 [Chlamydiae bacterium]|nr:hypothetical protein [Chlamydiota bacterium]